MYYVLLPGTGKVVIEWSLQQVETCGLSVKSCLHQHSLNFIILKETTAIMRQRRDVWTKGTSAGEEFWPDG
jgi:hypothetical protein